jgi:putative membrane protein
MAKILKIFSGKRYIMPSKEGENMMHYYGYGFGRVAPWGLGLGGIIINVLFALAVAFVIIALIRLFVGGRRHMRDEENNSDNALNILKERYAKGEITKKEFDSMKKDIS